MFLGGLFSDDPHTPHRVTGKRCVIGLYYIRLTTATAAGLRALDVGRLSAAFQVTMENPMSGLEGRCNLLLRLALALEGSEVFTGSTVRRPGKMLGALHQ